MIETPRKIRTRSLGLLELAKNVASTAPTACRRLHEIADNHDSLPASVIGASDPEGRRATSDLTSVERAAHARLGDLIPDHRGRYHPGPTRQLERISHLIGVASIALSELLDIAQNVDETPRMDDRSRCVAGEGFEWWTPPASAPHKTECDNVQEDRRNTGLCVACRKRRDRWNAE